MAPRQKLGDGGHGGVEKVPVTQSSVPEDGETVAPKVASSQYQKALKPVHGTFFTMLAMLSLLLACPPTVIYMWYILCKLDGSLVAFIQLCREGGIAGVWAVWPAPTLTAWAIIFSFVAFEIVLLLLLPGKIFVGPISPAGNRPIYKCNGLQAYFTTFAVYITIWRMGWFNPSIVYDHLGEIISALNIGSFLFCIFLYIKGHVAPSSSDWGSSGNIVFDFFWGMELYPRIGKWFDVKTFTNCRFGMMGWAVLVVTYAIKQYELNGEVADSMLVSVGLMLVYITKFFYWEQGYFSTMDIMHDRAGYYICWGCLVWVPCIYTSPAMFLVKQPVHLGPLTALSIAASGILCIWINYDSDRQRQHFRATNGKCTIWGAKPSKIEATYVTESGETKQSLLLTSGWWGLARHFHYVPEILASFFWSVPALFTHLLPYFYVIYLTILLLDRAIRDDERCRNKYKQYWVKYCKRVPYKVVPFLY
eukprot:TRINITY_DN5029_c0_g1_i1.p1 TRINITY_DN5029_c0_g1~~TRINITY_DN5029_c0_g1_i1.p1  ORF type:complete len:493 (+),score=88.62 TRINITY_DN5029_c0_g1_i1:52-1479(+)